MTAAARQPAGVPTGGQFAMTERPEAEVELTATDTPDATARDEYEHEGIVVGGDGYASHADCDPDDAIPGFFPDDDEDCWICGEEL